MEEYKRKAYKLIDYFILIALILSIFVFIIYPVYCVIKASFIMDGKLTLNLYKDLFTKHSKLFYNSIFVAILTTIISTLISVVVSIYISFSSGRMRKALMVVLMLTMISPPFVSSLSYITLFGRRGLITYQLLGLSIKPYGWQGIVAMQSLSSASMNSLILINTINGIDRDIIKSSLDLGASISYTIRKIILPLMKPGIVAIALLSFVRSLSDFGTPMIIGGSFNVLATHAYLNVVAYSNIELAAAICVMIFIPAGIAFYLYRRSMNKSNMLSNTNVSNDLFEENIKVSGPLWKLFKSISLLFLLIMILKYGAIFVQALTKYSFGEMYFTLDNVKKVKNYIGDSFLRSIRYGFVAGIGGGLMGSLVSYYIEVRKVRASRIIDFMTTIPNIVPGVFMGIGYILAFNHKPIELTGTSAIVILNIIFRQLPSNTKNSSAVLAQLSHQVEEAGKDLGAPDIFVLKDIILPMSKSAFMINFINNFKSTMTTVGAIIFLVYPGKKLATLEMFSSIRSGDYGTGAAIACFILIITLTINVVMSKVVMRWSNVR